MRRINNQHSLKMSKFVEQNLPKFVLFWLFKSILFCRSNLEVRKTMDLLQTDRQDIFVLQLMRPGAVGYLIAQPGDIDAMVMRVSVLSGNLVQTERQAISGILLMLGLSARRAGFHYLLEAIPAVRRDPDQAITKVLYRKIAKRHHADVGQVERCIRTAIQSAWVHRDDQVWKMFFPPGAGGSVPKPTNGEFIARLARLLDYWEVARDDAETAEPTR